jgi:hypothetical protein
MGTPGDAPRAPDCALGPRGGAVVVSLSSDPVLLDVAGAFGRGRRCNGKRAGAG